MSPYRKNADNAPGPPVRKPWSGISKAIIKSKNQIKDAIQNDKSIIDSLASTKDIASATPENWLALMAGIIAISIGFCLVLTNVI